jgi:hypothetical protein
MLHILDSSPDIVRAIQEVSYPGSVTGLHVGEREVAIQVWFRYPWGKFHLGNLFTDWTIKYILEYIIEIHLKI